MEVPSKEELFKELVQIIYANGVNIFELGNFRLNASEPGYIYYYCYNNYMIELIGGSWNQKITITTLYEPDDSLCVVFQQNTWGDPATIDNEKDDTLVNLHSLILNIMNYYEKKVKD